jgi:hypothetical protein
MKGGRKYIGEIVFNQNIDQYSKSKRDSLKREIYKKMVGNEWFIKNIEIRSPGKWSLMTGPKDKNFIKMKGSRVSVVFYGRSPLTKSKSRSKAQLNWVARNFKRSMNLDKKMFLDDSLKAIKVSVTVSPVNNKTKRKTKKKSKKQSGGVKPISVERQQLYRDIDGPSFRSDDSPTFNGRNFIKLRITDINNQGIMKQLFLRGDAKPGESWKNDKSYDYIIFSNDNSFIFLIKKITDGVHGHGSIPWTTVALEEKQYTEEKNVRENGSYSEGDAVLYAGEISFLNDGELKNWNNNSGHFEPDSLDGDTGARDILNEINMNLDKYEAATFEPRP